MSRVSFHILPCQGMTTQTGCFFRVPGSSFAVEPSHGLCLDTVHDFHIRPHRVVVAVSGPPHDHLGWNPEGEGADNECAPPGVAADGFP